MSSLPSLDNRKKKFDLLHALYHSYPGLKVNIQWCPVHAGIRGNEEADSLANTLTKKTLPNTFTHTPKTPAFLSAIKEWTAKQTETFTTDKIKRLGHKPRPKRHLDSISCLSKHEISTITQLPSGHVQLNAYLSRFGQLLGPTCDFQEGQEAVDHFLFICRRHNQHRAKLKNITLELGLRMGKTILSKPKDFKATTAFCDSSWRLKHQWVWATVIEEGHPANITQPQE